MLDIYIVDTFGETKKFHKIGCSVFIGGSIINKGGQNPLEAALDTVQKYYMVQILIISKIFIKLFQI